MWETLNALRKKPRAVRNRYAVIGAFSVTAVVAATWLIVLTLNIGATQSTLRTEQSASPIFSSFFSSTKKQFGNLKAQLQSLGDELEEAATTTASTTASTTAAASSSSLPAEDIAAATGTATGTSSASPARSTEEEMVRDVQDPDPGPPPGRATGREVRIATSGATGTTP